jgi:recombination protein RecA
VKPGAPKETKVKPPSPAPAGRAVDPSQELLDGILEHMKDESSAMLLGDDVLKMKIRGVVSTQLAELDAAIGRGGAPFGRLTIIHGGEGSGKTSLALHLVSEVQKMGGVAVYIDKEYKLDPEYAEKLGVDIKRLIISQPPYLEKVFDVIEGSINKMKKIREATGKRIPVLIVLDSMNACIGKAEYEGDMESQHMAVVARLFSQKLPKILPLVSEEDIALVFISQVRKKFGVTFGDDEELAGGNAPKFYASLIIHVKRRASERSEAGEKIANLVQFECKKNQIAPPFRKALLKVRYGYGFDRVLSVLNRAIAVGLVDKSGTWFSYGSDKLGQGEEKAVATLKSNKELYQKLEAALRKAEGWG